MSTSLSTVNTAVNNKALFDSCGEANLYLDNNKVGFFSILQEIPGQPKKKQTSYKLQQLAEVIQILPKDRNTWISQGEFNRPNRRVVNLARLSLCFVDIDCYNVNLSPQIALELLFVECDKTGIPFPSIAINSGRGLQVKWLFDEPVERYVLPMWNALQNVLTNAFLHLGADQNSKDASRVLRLVDTINTKSEIYTRVEHVTYGPNGGPLQYNFDHLCKLLLPEINNRFSVNTIDPDHPYSIDQQISIAAAREKRDQSYKDRKNNLHLATKNDQIRNVLHRFSGRQLAWHRQEDIRKLIKIRGGIKAGQGMTTIFWLLNFLLLSGATNSVDMYKEAQELCNQYHFGDFVRKDELFTLYTKAKEMEAGKKVTDPITGVKYAPLYTPKNSKLIDLFNITDDEQRQLRTIISTDVAKERDAERSAKRRRLAGAVTRDEYINFNNYKKLQVIEMNERGLSSSQISRDLSIPRSSVVRWIKSN